MIYFLFEINGFKQLKQIEAEKTKAITDSLYRILGIREYNLLRSDKDYLLLSIVYKEIHKDRIIDAIYSCYEFLKKQEKLLQAFSIIVDFNEEKSDETVFNNLLSRLFQTSSLNSLFVTEKMNEIFSSYFEGKREGPLFRITQRKDYIDPLFSRGGILHHRENVRQLMIETIVEYYQNEDQKDAVIHLHSSENSCVRKNLKRALREIGGNDEPEWCWIEFSSDLSGICPPFIEGIMDIDFLKYSEFLSENDKLILASNTEFEKLEDHLHEDLFIRFIIFIRSYIKFCRKNYIPPVVVFEAVDKINEKCLSLVLKILNNMKNAVPVIITNSDELPGALEEIAVIDIPIKDMEKEELIKKLPQIGNDKNNFSEIIEICERNPDYLFYYSFLKAKGHSLKNLKKKSDLCTILIRNFEPAVQEIYYIVCLSFSFLNLQEITGFLQKIDIEDEIIDAALDELASLNLLEIDHDHIRIEKTENLKIVKQLIRNDTDEISEKLIDYISEKNDKKHWMKNGLITFLIRNLRSSSAMDLLLDIMMHLLDCREIEFVMSVIDKCSGIYARKMRQNSRLGDLISFVRLRVALLEGDEITASNVFSSLPSYSAAEPGLINIILQGKYHNAVKNYRTAMVCLKSLLVKVEEHQQPVAVGEAYLELGLSFLGLRKLEEAREYFFIAQEHSNRFRITYQYIRSLIMHAVSLQLIGNYSEAYRLLNEAVDRSNNAGSRVWELLAVFLLGRTQFELGEYEKSAATFQKALTISQLYDIREAFPVFFRWIARSFDFSGRYKGAEKILKNCSGDTECDFFLAETLYFSGKRKDARELLSGSKINLKSETFRPSENIVYKTGFSMVEDFALSSVEGECVLSYLHRSFSSYLNGLTGAASEATADLFSITREDKLSDVDPNNHLYYLFYTLVASDKGDSPSLDRITLLSKGLKILQERASAIDSPKERRAYLNDNKWNAILLEEAKKLKLT